MKKKKKKKKRTIPPKCRWLSPFRHDLIPEYSTVVISPSDVLLFALWSVKCKTSVRGRRIRWLKVSVWRSRTEIGRGKRWWKWRGETLEDGDIKMIISLYKAVNYEVIINQEILSVDIYNNVALINLLRGTLPYKIGLWYSCCFCLSCYQL